MKKTVKTLGKARSGRRTVVDGVLKVARRGNTTTLTLVSGGLLKLEGIKVLLDKDGQYYWDLMGDGK